MKPKILDEHAGRTQHVTIRFATASITLDLVAKRAPILPYPTNGSARFEVAVGSKGAVITALDDQEQPSWSIARPRGGGAIYWDHGQHTSLAWSESELHCGDTGDSRVAVPNLQLDIATRTATLRWNDPGMGAVRMFIICDATDTPPDLRAGLLDALFGNGCCSGAFPSHQIAALGMPRHAEIYVGAEKEAVVTTEIDEGRPTPMDASTLGPPSGFKPIEVTLDAGKAPVVANSPYAPTGPVTQALETSTSVSRNQQALESEDVITPSCMANTRLAPMVGVVHQDLLDNVRAAINLAAPHLGTVTLAGGTLTIPWLRSLEAADVLSNGTGPGSGLYTILRQNRQLVPLSGGTGVLDRLVWKLFSTPDPVTGRTLLQQRALDGTLAATLTRWNTPTNVSSILLANGGDIRDMLLTDADRSELVEAFEVFDVGTISLPAIPAVLPPILWPTPVPGGPDLSLITLTLISVSGTIAFGPVGSPPLVPTFAIGANGTIDITVALPTTTIGATVLRTTTVLGNSILIGAAATCAFLPFACALVAPLALLLRAILNDLTRITAAIPTTTLSFRVTFRFDQATRHVEPLVSLVAATGAATVTTTSSPPSSIAAAFNSVVADLGNAINAWPTLMGVAISGGIQSLLRSQGIRFPLGVTRGLTATDGSALSTPNGMLTLVANVEPFSNTVAQPWITQVPPALLVRNRVETMHIFARRELNPQVITGTMPATLAVGVYGALALTQNVINAFVYARWRDGVFNLDLRDPALVAKLVDTLPSAMFGLARPRRISIWPATPPRLELAPDGLHAGELLDRTTDPMRVAELDMFSTGVRPLVAWFDDVRVCFDATAAGGDFLNSGQGEFSFNFRTTATLELRWPFALELRTDSGPGSVRLTEIRAMEFADGSLLSIPLDPTQRSWIALATQVANLMAQQHDASGVTAAHTASAWRRPNPSVVQKPGGDTLTLELLAARKTLTLLPMLRFAGLELVDGSGAPTLASLLGVNAPLIVGTLTRTQGTILRTRLGPLLDAAGLEAFPGP